MTDQTWSTTSYIATAIVALVVLAVYRISQIGKRDPRLPPGPPTVPVLGNAHLIPTTGLAKKFQEWAREYGPIFSLKVGPGTIIIISDRRAVNTLFDKRGAVYADRPRADVAMWVTNENHFSFEQNSKGWKEKRAIATRFFSPKLLDEHHFKVQEAEATCLMYNVYRHSDKLPEYAKLYTVSVLCSLLYGQRAPDLDSFWYKEFYEHMEGWTAVLEPGANPPVEQFPWLWYLPGQWKKRAADVKKTRHDLWTHARKIVDKRRATGDKRDCLLDAKLDEYAQKGWPFDEWVVNYLFGEMVEGGADTTANHLLTLILALAAHPHVQERAYRELEAVCGADRAPVWSDFDKCPYINCIVKEGMRWRPTARSGLPHLAVQDDVYDNYLIPKGSTVFMSVWTMHQNDTIFQDAEKFNPDRYLNHPRLANEYATSSDYENRDHYGYGSGRRMCPGIHLAERNMWRIAAKLIWAFKMYEDPSAPLDVDGYTSSILVSPLPFKVKVEPRSQKHMETVQRELVQALEFLKQYE
ncbi:putative cytochrome P450 oxidoreductase [Exophiala viscosa]|uniref:Cytochrome P450 oxidoreductase n=2 Tax=Exophiala viscosa TaxID=2486360 RepID=A0AAN6IHP8_9EURO|nr:putative cytochrome P450 oxidoreductase [Exophiala viscosa]